MTIEENTSLEEQQLDGIAENTEQETGAEPEPQEPEQQQPQEPTETPETGYQKRINRLTAEKYEFKRRAETFEQELAKYRNESPATTSQSVPTLEQFDYDDAKYQEALIDYKVSQRMQQAQAQQEHYRKQQTAQQKAADFARKVAAANIPDYAETIDQLSQAVYLPPEAIEAIQQLDNGPHVAYYLGKHLDIADSVASRGAIGAALEIGRISAQLATKNNKTAAISKAPDPIKPIHGGGTGSKSQFDMTMEEIMALDD